MTLLILLAMLFVFHLFYKIAVSYTVKCVSEASNRIMLCYAMLSHFSHVRLSVTPWTAAYQAPRSMGFSRQEYWSGVPLPYETDDGNSVTLDMGRNNKKKYFPGPRG